MFVLAISSGSDLLYLSNRAITLVSICGFGTEENNWFRDAMS